MVGAVSYGPDQACGHPKIPGVYVKVKAYLDWIKETAKDGQYCQDPISADYDYEMDEY